MDLKATSFHNLRQYDITTKKDKFYPCVGTFMSNLFSPIVTSQICEIFLELAGPF